MLLRFETRPLQRRPMWKIEAKFRTFWTPVKIRGVIGEMFEWDFSATRRT